MNGSHIQACWHESPRKVPTYTAWWTEAHWCEQLAQGRCLTMPRPGIEPTICGSQVRRPNHYTTEPLGVRYILLQQNDSASFLWVGITSTITDCKPGNRLYKVAKIFLILAGVEHFLCQFLGKYFFFLCNNAEPGFTDLENNPLCTDTRSQAVLIKQHIERKQNLLENISFFISLIPYFFRHKGPRTGEQTDEQTHRHRHSIGIYEKI